MRLITARSSASRNSRGFGLPACGRGVSVPTSTKPKPSPASARAPRILVEPGGEPDRRGEASPATSIASDRKAAAAARQQLQRPDRRAMRPLGVEREGERADEG
jgi:hypothetical protein